MPMRGGFVGGQKQRECEHGGQRNQHTSGKSRQERSSISRGGELVLGRPSSSCSSTPWPLNGRSMRTSLPAGRRALRVVDCQVACVRRSAGVRR